MTSTVLWFENPTKNGFLNPFGPRVGKTEIDRLRIKNSGSLESKLQRVERIDRLGSKASYCLRDATLSASTRAPEESDSYPVPESTGLAIRNP